MLHQSVPFTYDHFIIKELKVSQAFDNQFLDKQALKIIY